MPPQEAPEQVTSPPELHTDRLLLRGFSIEDAADVFAYASDPEVLRYTTGVTPVTPADSERFVQSLLDNPPGAFAWALLPRSGGRVIGAVEFGIGDGRTGSIHYALARDRWNGGLMTEACRAVLDWGFASHPGLERVTTSAVVENRASTRVMEKCGFKREGVMKRASIHPSISKEPRDCVLWAKTR